MKSTHKPATCSALSCTARRAHRRAFTLIELLTVIAIIGILAAILIPTVAAVRKKARKAECASNLHQLGMAINLYTNDNKGKLPDGDKSSPQSGTDSSAVQWIPYQRRDELISYGMTWDMFFCNGNLEYTNNWKTEAQRVIKQNLPIGYIYLPGTSLNTFDQSGRQTPSKYTELRFTKVNYRLIAVDVNRKYNNSFTSGTNHGDNNTPVGGNHLYIDGAVKWIPSSEFINRVALRDPSAQGTDYFFKTED